MWGGLSGATPAEAVSWGKVNPGVLPDTVVAYCDSTIAFPLFCEYAVGSEHNRRPRRELVHKREALVADLVRQAQGCRRRRRARRSLRRSRRRSIATADGHAVVRAGPLVEQVADQPRVYADANLPLGVVAFMREKLGWDVLFVMEHDDLRRARDIEHFRLARQLGRTLVTLDRDYLDDRMFPAEEGAGVIVFCVARRALAAAAAHAHGSRAVPRARTRARCRSSGARWSGTSMLSLGA